MSEQPDWTEQARRLIAGLGGMLSAEPPHGAGPSSATSSGSCRWCPLCQAAAFSYSINHSANGMRWRGTGNGVVSCELFAATRRPSSKHARPPRTTNISQLTTAFPLPLLRSLIPHEG